MTRKKLGEVIVLASLSVLGLALIMNSTSADGDYIELHQKDEVIAGAVIKKTPIYKPILIPNHPGRPELPSIELQSLKFRESRKNVLRAHNQSREKIRVLLEKSKRN